MAKRKRIATFVGQFELPDPKTCGKRELELVARLRKATEGIQQLGAVTLDTHGLADITRAFEALREQLARARASSA